MKKLRFMMLPILLLGILTASCNNDDDSSGSGDDVIVGTWKISNVWVGEESIYDELLSTNFCAMQNLYNFMADNSLEIDTFEEGITPENCVIGVQQTGSWSKNNNVYTVTFDDSGETSSSVVEFQNNNKFTTQTTFQGQNVLLEFSRQ